MLARSAIDGVSEEEAYSAENRVRVGSGRVVILHMLIGCLEHDLGRRKHRHPDIVELRLAGARRRIQIGPSKSARLQILVGVAVERDGLPFAVQDSAEREMVGNLARD